MNMTDEAHSLTGRVAVVTGAGGGLGTAIVDALATGGATVVATDLAPPDPGRYQADGNAIVSMACDVADVVSVDSTIEAVVAQLGRVDILVNNAGVFETFGSVHRITPEQWERDIKVNLSGPFYLTHAVLPHMVSQGWGRIVNISSMSSGGAYKQASYGATKLGLIGLTATVASEFGAAGITCNAVLPGLIGTPKALTAPQDILDGALAAIPAGRFGRAEEIGDMVAYLATPAAAYVNGASIPVDGGTSLLHLRFSRRSSLGAQA